MATEPVEIKLTLDTSGVKRDLDRMKKALKQESPGGGFKTDLKPGGGFGQSGVRQGFGGSPGLQSPAAFPSGAGAGTGEPGLSKLAQKDIEKTIGKFTKGAVEKEIKGINWQSVIKGYLQNGTRGALGDLAFQGGKAATGALEGAAAGEGAGAAAAGAAGVVLSAAGYVAIAAVVAPLVAKKMADDADTLSVVVGALAAIIPGFDKIDDAVTWFQNKAAEVDAFIQSNKNAVGKTLNLEGARARIGQTVDLAQVGSDYAKIQKIEAMDLQVKRRTASTSNREVARELIKQFVAGGR